MRRIKTVAGLIAVNFWCWGMLFVLSIVSLAVSPAWLISGRLRGWKWDRCAREGIWLYGRFYINLISPFIKVDISGENAAVQQGPVVVVVNHQSWLDIYILAAQGARNLCMLVRSWPFKRLFFFRPIMQLAGYVETEGTNVDDIFQQCRENLQHGAVIVCFPEGTRGSPGSLGRFHSGVFKIASDLEASVVPLIIHHSGRIMQKKSLLFKAGVIKMEMGPPICPSQFAQEHIPHGAMRRFVRDRFKKSLGLK